MRKIKAIQIDPFACTVNEVELDGDDYQTTYPLLSHEAHPVTAFEAIYWEGLQANDAVFIDEFGRLNAPERFFLLSGFPEPLAGKGLIIGANDDGNSISCSTPIETVRANATFAQLVPGTENQLMRTETPWQPPSKQ